MRVRGIAQSVAEVAAQSVATASKTRRRYFLTIPLFFITINFERNKMETLILIDANSLINRAFYALPPLNDYAGRPTQAVFGFTVMLVKLIETYSPKYLAAAFDLAQPTFRHEKFDAYKATRKGMPDELASQVPVLKNLLDVMGIKRFEIPGYEADDIIGTLAKKFDVKTYIITGDKDSLQLVDETTSVLLTKRGISEMELIDASNIKSKFSLTPHGIIEYKALAGDKSDNIPGIFGIGEKTAIELIEKYGTLDNIYAHVDELQGKTKEKIIAGKDTAYLSEDLATIVTDAPLSAQLDELVFQFPFKKEVRDFFGKYNFKSLYKRNALFESCRTIIRENSTIATARSDEIDLQGDFAFYIGDSLFIGNENCNYEIKLSANLIDGGENLSDVMNNLKPILADPSRLKVVYDYKQLLSKLSGSGVKINNVFDIKLAQYLINTDTDYETFTGLLGIYGYDASGYGAYKVYEAQLEQLKIAGLNDLYYNIEFPLEEVLYNMECRGFKLDLEKLEQLRQKYSTEAEFCQKKIFELAGRSFNINSPKQLAEVLFQELKLPYPKKKSKSFSTGAEILEPLADEFEIAAYVLRYRLLMKLVGTYLDGLKKQTDPDGLVHTEFKQMITSTGRLSSVDPNLQNIPVRDGDGKALREMFVAGEGKSLVSADYSQIELRLMAHLSGDEKMIDCFRRGEDIHTSTAAEIYGVPPEMVTEAMRREAKTVNFGIIYGISDYGLAQNLKVSVIAAKKYIEKYFERFSGIKNYLKEAVDVVRKNGYAKTLFGRIRYVPEINSPNYNTRLFGERVAMNMPLQGSAADIIKIAMLKTEEALKSTGARLILQIHDELIVEAPDEETELVKQILKDCMENAAKLSVPLNVSVGCGKNWLDCK